MTARMIVNRSFIYWLLDRSSHASCSEMACLRTFTQAQSGLSLRQPQARVSGFLSFWDGSSVRLHMALAPLSQPVGARVGAPAAACDGPEVQSVLAVLHWIIADDAARMLSHSFLTTGESAGALSGSGITGVGVWH